MNKQLTAPSTKKELREYYRSIRSCLSDHRRKEAANACFTFFSSSTADNSKVLSFASKSDEINLWLLNDWLAARAQLILPKVNQDFLDIYRVENTATLTRSSYSILEPNPESCEKADLQDIDIVLVPGLCFDESFSRIGYGKGHYDRLLEMIRKTNPKALIWGVGFKEQLSESPLAIESHDVQLDNIFLF